MSERSIELRLEGWIAWVREQHPNAPRAIAVIIAIDSAIWSFQHIIRPAIDAAAEIQFVVQNWQPTLEAVRPIVAEALDLAFSTPVAIGTFILGFGYLVLDRRVARLQQSPTTSLPVPAAPQEPQQEPQQGTERPNIICARAEVRYIQDPFADSRDFEPPDIRAMLAAFHNAPTPHASPKEASSVTATIVYEGAEPTEVARVLKATWITDSGSLANHTSFAPNSIRQLIIAAEQVTGFSGLENLRDEQNDPQYGNHFVQLPGLTEGLARVTLTIDGKVDATEYLFFVNLDRQSPQCVFAG